MSKFILKLRKRLRILIDTTNTLFSNKKDFATRIAKRHKAFWDSADAEAVRNMTMSAGQPLAAWKDAPHWQRKLSNKYNAREFAILHDCQVPELYWKGRNIDTIPFDKLPPYYVIRPTIGHSCDLVFLMADSVNLMDKQTYGQAKIKSLLSEALEKNQYVEFLFEEFVKTEDGKYKIPDDYKFYMFNGEIARILLINRIGPKEGSMCAYDKDWKMMESNTKHRYAAATAQLPPKCLNEMVEYAKVLSKEYEIFVRIDFYATDKGAVFGEFTPTPGLGKDFTPQSDKLLSNYWDKFCRGKI